MKIDFKKRENFKPSEKQQNLIKDELVLFEQEPSFNEIIDNTKKRLFIITFVLLYM